MAEQTIRLQVQIDADELLRWAGRHADAGHPAVAHALYKAAEGIETLGEQAIREAKAEAWDEGHEAAALRVPEGTWHDMAAPHPGNPYREADR